MFMHTCRTLCTPPRVEPCYAWKIKARYLLKTTDKIKIIQHFHSIFSSRVDKGGVAEEEHQWGTIVEKGSGIRGVI